MWADISNYTRELTDAGCAELKAASIVGVIVQAVWGTNGVSYTRQQLECATRNSLLISGYVFPGSLSSKLALFDGYTLVALWLDVELPISKASVNLAFATCDAYMHGKLTGIYSGRWFFQAQGWLNFTGWSNRPLWDSNFDQIALVNVDFRPYGGWDHPAVKQFVGTSSIGSVHQIDQDVWA